MMKFAKQDEGAIIIMVAVMLAILIGFAALAIDVGLWYQSERQLQLAADAGATGGASALGSKGQAVLVGEATYDINLNGCTTSNNCKIVAINNPPATGPNTGNNSAVEVILSRPAELYLSKVFLNIGPTLHARAVAGQEVLNNCLTSLSNSGTGINIAGGGTFNASSCSVFSNSSDQKAINVVGNSILNAEYVKIVGNYITSGGGVINSTMGIATGSSATADPYPSLTVPNVGSCLKTNYKQSGGTATLSPGLYCGGIKTEGSAKLTLNPGIYVLQGDLDISAQSTFQGTGVTLIITKNTSGPKYGEVTFNAGAIINLSATTSSGSAYKGILFYGDRLAPATNSNKINGGAGQKIAGIVYFPSSSVTYGGQATVSGDPCVRFIAWNLSLAGGTNLGPGCPATGGPIKLLE